jgi:hypothetical protein
MSGGRFGYLYARDLAEALASGEFESMALSMRESAIEAPELEAAAAEMEDMLNAVEGLRSRFERLSPVLHAYEWYRSGDRLMEDVVEVARKFSATPPPDA